MTDEEVLIKLKRQYSKDEYVQALLKKISDLEIEQGKLKSEIHEHEYEKEQWRKREKESLKKELSQKIHNKINRRFAKLNGEIERLRKSNEELINQLNTKQAI